VAESGSFLRFAHLGTSVFWGRLVTILGQNAALPGDGGRSSQLIGELLSKGGTQGSNAANIRKDGGLLDPVGGEEGQHIDCKKSP